MDLYVTELPEVGLPGCCLLQECWEAAGVSTGLPTHDTPRQGPAAAGRQPLAGSAGPTLPPPR